MLVIILSANTLAFEMAAYVLAFVIVDNRAIGNQSRVAVVCIGFGIKCSFDIASVWHAIYQNVI